MFYIIEIFLRLKYCFFSFCLLLVVIYKYNNVLFIIFFHALLKCNKEYNQSDASIQLTYTNPSELININSILIILFLFIFILPYLIWQSLDFFKSSFYRFEYISLFFFINLLLVLISVFNCFAFLIIFPKLWSFYMLFNSISSLNNPLKLFFELTVQNYFVFMIDLIYYLNIFASLIFLLALIFFHLSLRKVLSLKNLFIFFSLLIIVLVSPPDITSQIFLFLLLIIILDFYFFFKILWFKLVKFFL